MYNPVPGSYVSSEYLGGFRSTGGHSGIDFAAPRGTRILAVTGGTVISTGNGGAYGRLVKVRHQDGSVAYYAHLDTYSVKPGQKITRGTVLGRVGNTGNVRGRNGGYHLHFEVRVNGKPTNPMPWLKGSPSDSHSRQPLAGYGGGTEHQHSSETTTRDNTALMEMLEGMDRQPGSAPYSTPGGGFLMASPLRPEEGEGLDSNPMALDSMLGQEEMFRRRHQDSFDMGEHLLPQIGAPNVQEHTLPAPSKGTGNAFVKLLNAIGRQESGNNYGAVNRHSGALGKYQIMPGNIASWSKAALGYSITPQQFLRDSRIQERIARYQLGQYYNKYGAAGAALAWYAGEGALKYSSAAKNRPQGGYPSMNSYVQQVLRKAGL